MKNRKRKQYNRAQRITIKLLDKQQVSEEEKEPPEPGYLMDIFTTVVIQFMKYIMTSLKRLHFVPTSPLLRRYGQKNSKPTET
jgi:hypothetical protein